MEKKKNEQNASGAGAGAGGAAAAAVAVAAAVGAEQKGSGEGAGGIGRIVWRLQGRGCGFPKHARARGSRGDGCTMRMTMVLLFY